MDPTTEAVRYALEALEKVIEGCTALEKRVQALEAAQPKPLEFPPIDRGLIPGNGPEEAKSVILNPDWGMPSGGSAMSGFSDGQRARLLELLPKMEKNARRAPTQNEYFRRFHQIEDLKCLLDGNECGPSVEEWIAIAEKAAEGHDEPKHPFEPFEYNERS